MITPPPTTAPLGMRYMVRVIRRIDQRFVVFDFAINDADLTVELILPTAEFHEFCHRYQVRLLTQSEKEHVDAERARWGTATPYRAAPSPA